MYTKKILLFLSGMFFLVSGAQSQNVNIPDANFKALLVAHPGINTNSDTEIQLSEAAAFSGFLVASGANIADLTGIEAFTNLTELDCSSNLLFYVDISHNAALSSLWCYENNLSTLDLTQNAALTLLDCGLNPITSLDLSANTGLAYLNCSDDLLTSLDLSANTALVGVICSNNQISGLDLSAQHSLNTLLCNGNALSGLNVKNGNNIAVSDVNFAAYDNPALSCIEVDNVTYSTSNWSGIDPGAVFSLSCNGAALKESNKSAAITISPNPCSSAATIRSGQILTDAHITIYTIGGQPVREINSSFAETIRIQRDQLPAGMYFIQIEEGGRLLSVERLLISDN